MTGWERSRYGPWRGLRISTVAVWIAATVAWSIPLNGEEPVPLPSVDWGSSVESLPPPDALFLARYAALEDRPLVLNEDTGGTIISSQNLQWGFAPGMRV